MSPQILEALKEARAALERLPVGVPWYFAIDDEASTGEADTTPTLEVAARSEEEFQALAALFFRPAGEGGEVVVRLPNLVVEILRPRGDLQ